MNAPVGLYCNSNEGFIMESQQSYTQYGKWKTGDLWSSFSRKQLDYFSASNKWSCLDTGRQPNLKYPAKDVSWYLWLISHKDLLKIQQVSKLR